MSHITPNQVLEALEKLNSHELLEICYRSEIDIRFLDQKTNNTLRQSMIDWAISIKHLERTRLRTIFFVAVNMTITRLFLNTPIIDEFKESYYWELKIVDGLSKDNAKSILQNKFGELFWSNSYIPNLGDVADTLSKAGVTHCIITNKYGFEINLLEPLESWLERHATQLNQLRTQVADERVIPFVGAGLSIESGFSAWSPFMTDIFASQRNIFSYDDVFLFIFQGHFEGAASIVEKEWGKLGFNKAISTTYGAPAEKIVPQGAVTLLPELFKRGLLLTTNFDNVLEKVYLDAGNPLSIKLGLDAQLLQLANQHTTQPVLFKIHGDIIGTERVLTRAEYEFAYAPDGSHRKALESIFHNRSLLFLGSSLRYQDRTVQVLTECASSPDAAFEHFAIVEANPFEPDQYNRLVQAGITPLIYPPGHHSFVAAALASLLGVNQKIIIEAILKGSIAFSETILSHIKDKDSVQHIESKNMIDVGIITMKEEEYDALLDQFGPTQHVAGKNRDYEVTSLSTRGGGCQIAITRCAQQGNIFAQTAANEILEDLKPRFLLVVGIAGGVPTGDFCLGDVVVSDYIQDMTIEDTGTAHGCERYNALGGPLHPSASRIVERLRAVERSAPGWNSNDAIACPRPGLEGAHTTNDADWNASIDEALDRHKSRNAPRGTARKIASSDRLIKDPELLQKWRQILKAVAAVEMESAGIYMSCQRQKIPFLAIRGISDIIGWKRDEAWTLYACHTAAAYAKMLVNAGVFVEQNPINS